MKILVIGTGYVGLVTGACFADMGFHVTCLDIDKKKIALLNSGKIPIYEPGLEEIVQKNAREGRLEFTTEYERNVEEAAACFLAVSTPSREDGSANLEYLQAAVEQLARHMHSYKVIINKSTAPVGTVSLISEMIRGVLLRRGLDLEYDVVSNPEFLKEGDAVRDFMRPDRIVIGTASPRAAALMQELYAPFNLNHERILLMDPLSAEMTKYAANAMLATRISFMNELANLCEYLGADISKVRKGIGSDTRIGYAFLYAGAGYGGSCFPKDLHALQAMAKQCNYETPLLDAVDVVNQKQKKVMMQKLEHYFHDKGGLNEKTIGIWGLAFKPGTDDLREAPALDLIRALLSGGAFLRLYDPIALLGAKELFKKNPQIKWCRDEFDAADGADAIVLMTEWKQFRLVDFQRIKQLMRGQAFFDGRNQYSTSEMVAKGFDYFCIGRQPKLKCSIQSI